MTSTAPSASPSRLPPPPSPPSTPRKRRTCPRCARPVSVCLCAHLPPTPLATSTSITIFETAAERKAKVRTATLLPPLLSNLALLPARLSSLLHLPPDAILLFPGPRAVRLDAVAAPGATLVLLDGTWDSARRFLRRAPALQQLRRAFVPQEFLGDALFRARKPPVANVPGARSTAEAVAGALECVEGEAVKEVVRYIRKVVHEASEMQLRFVRGKREDEVVHRREKRGYIEGLYAEVASEEGMTGS